MAKEDRVAARRGRGGNLGRDRGDAVTSAQGREGQPVEARVLRPRRDQEVRAGGGALEGAGSLGADEDAAQEGGAGARPDAAQELVGAHREQGAGERPPPRVGGAGAKG